MRELSIQHQGKPLGMVTFSIGIGVFPDHGVSPRELMAAADAALYEAKRGGRDRVAVAAPKNTPDMAIPKVANSAAGWD